MQKLLWATLCVAGLCVGLSACDDEVVRRPGGDGGGGNSDGGGGNVPGGSSDKLDILLMVDNSRSMADKQALLASGVSEMLAHFTGTIRDIHIGVVSSSLGGHGADACTTGPTENDRGHLLARTLPGDPAVATWDGRGFLAWDPLSSKTPPGSADEQGLAGELAALVRGAGEEGCGYEAQLESWYRFLIDPDPYEQIVLNNNLAELQGTDQAILQQRADFLRPDSVLLVVMISDENDCSTRDGGQFYFANQIYEPSTNSPYHLPKPRAACATDPDSDCCRSCGQVAGDGCSQAADDCSGPLAAIDDSINLRCFDQKRRFGIDFMWDVARYVEGLSATQVSDRHGNIVANPLFTGGRDPSMVYLAGILGVPGPSAEQLRQTGSWDAIAQDPLMVESIEPRPGVAGPSAGYLANPIHGHDRSIPQRDDLQYTCIFPLGEPRDCTVNVVCDCYDANNDNPVCQAPSGAYGTTQYFARAYPGKRQLHVMEQLGSRAILGSVCPSSPADGYASTFAAIADEVSGSLAP